MKLGRIIHFMFLAEKIAFRSEELAPVIAAGSPEVLPGDVSEDRLHVDDLVPLDVVGGPVNVSFRNAKEEKDRRIRRPKSVLGARNICFGSGSGSSEPKS